MRLRVTKCEVVLWDFGIVSEMQLDLLLKVLWNQLEKLKSSQCSGLGKVMLSLFENLNLGA